MSFAEIITWYSVKSETQPFAFATSIVTVSTTGQYFLINSCLPSNLSIVAVNPRICLYLIVLNTYEN